MKTMRDVFFETLYEIAKVDKRVIVLSNDMGAPSLDVWREKLHKQYINCGIAEQNMMGVAAGLARAGYKPYVYGIAPFVTLRCLEQIKLDICSMGLNVVIVGVGAGTSYGTAGMTHHAMDDIGVMRLMHGMRIYSPCDGVSTEFIAKLSHFVKAPAYVRLDRNPYPNVYPNMGAAVDGVFELRKGKGICFVTTGSMAHKVWRDAKKINAGIIDITQVAPFNWNHFKRLISRYEKFRVYEEHGPGGLADILKSEMGGVIDVKTII